MRKVSPEIARCVFFGAIALILGACMKPVGVSTFLADDKVQDIINASNSGIIVNPGYENPEDIPPVLVLLDGTFVTPDEPVIVTLGNSVTIIVDNYEDYDGDVEWFYGDSILGTGETFVVVTGVYPFDEAGRYALAVVGTRNNVPYSIEIFIVVEEEDEDDEEE